MLSPWSRSPAGSVHARSHARLAFLVLIALITLISTATMACRTRRFNSDRGSFAAKKPEESAWKEQPILRVGACHGEAVVDGQPLMFVVRNFDGNHSSIVRLEVAAGTLSTLTDSTPAETLTLSGAGLFVVVPAFGGKGGGSFRYASEYLGPGRLGDGTSLRHLDEHLGWYERNPAEKHGGVYEKRVRQVKTLRTAHGEQLAQKARIGATVRALGTGSVASEIDIAVDYMPNPRLPGSGGDGDLTVRWTMKGTGTPFEAKLKCESALSKGLPAEGLAALDAQPGVLLEFVKFILDRKGGGR